VRHLLRLRVPLGRVAGIRIGLHASWFLVFGLVVWLTASGFADIYPRMAVAERAVSALATGVAFFACLTVHELAHAVASRRFGIRVRGITLFLFGGVAEIEGEIDRPSTEFAVALVGPAASIVLGSGFGLGAVAGAHHGWSAVEAICGTLALVNLGVAAFNLVPGLPLDGGRLLRAGLWRLWEDRSRATRIASVGGRVVAALLAVIGVVLAIVGDPFGLWYVPMGAFLWLLAGASTRAVPTIPAPAPTARALAWGNREGEAAQPGP
jgi:Zn-dependent protease